jgi:hypothetical protein
VRTRGFLLAVLVAGVAVGCLAAVPTARGAIVYRGFEKVGSVTGVATGGWTVSDTSRQVGRITASYYRFNVFRRGKRVGHVSGYSDTVWSAFSGSTRVGVVRRTYGGRWLVYRGYQVVGSVNGGPGPAVAGAALLLLLLR